MGLAPIKLLPVPIGILLPGTELLDSPVRTEFGTGSFHAVLICQSAEYDKRVTNISLFIYSHQDYIQIVATHPDLVAIHQDLITICKDVVTIHQDVVAIRQDLVINQHLPSLTHTYIYIYIYIYISYNIYIYIVQYIYIYQYGISFFHQTNIFDIFRWWMSDQSPRGDYLN